MIALAFALAITAPPEIPDDFTSAEEPAFEADTTAVAEEPPPPKKPGDLTPDQFALMKQAIAKADAERAAENAARNVLRPVFDPDLKLPAPDASPNPPQRLQPTGPVLDHDPNAYEPGSMPPVLRPSNPVERMAALAPLAFALAAFFSAIVALRFLRPRWRAYLSSAQKIGAGYWREIGLFTMLGAILIQLW